LNTESLQESPLHHEVHGELVRRFLNPLPEFHLLSRRDEGRESAEAFVQDRYRAQHGAAVTHFLPWLFTMQCLGSPSGVAGLQPAGPAPLFLEQYLDGSVEEVLAAKGACAVERRAIVEVGNLVAARRGASHLLFLLFTATLATAGYRWIVFTATQALRNNLENLGLPLMELQRVTASTLPPEIQAVWGSYYATDPRVMAASLDEVTTLIGSKALYRHIGRLYRGHIRSLAERLGR